MTAMDPAENAGHVWHDTRGPESACKRCGLFYAQWSGARCYVAPDCDGVFAPGVMCDRELGHDGGHRAEVTWGMTAPGEMGLGSKEQISAVIAAVTELIHSTPDDRLGYLQAFARVLREVPHDVHFHISTHLVHVLLRQLARTEGRGVDQVWRDIALILAEEIPEDDS